jgi:hypothetical protein
MRGFSPSPTSVSWGGAKARRRGVRAGREGAASALSRSERRPPQNVYDDPTFFAGYKDLREKDAGLNGALETPALRARLPALSG